MKRCVVSTYRFLFFPPWNDMAPKTNIAEVKSRLIYVQLGIMVAFLVVALMLVYWTVIRGPSILLRADNPRQVDATLNTIRGRILDVNGLTLAETRDVDGELVRQYAINGTGPIVGYYSFRHGTSGIEDSYDQLLSGSQGDPWSDYWSIELLHQPQQGNDIQLTLDSYWQKRSEALFEEEHGASIMLSLADMEIFSMTSSPGYDPNVLDEQFERYIDDETAPLLNRATQGQYQPGFVLLPYTLASLASKGIIDLDSEIAVNDQQSECKLEIPGSITWAELLFYQCSAPLIELSQSLDAETVATIFGELGFFSTPDIPIEKEFSDETVVRNLDLALIGQGRLAVSPVQIAIAAAALVNDGLLRQPKLIAALQDSDGRWITQDSTPIGDSQVSIFDESTANLILSSLSEADGILEYSSLVPSATEPNSNAWYVGFAPSDDPQYAVVIVLENKEDLGSAESIGRMLLTEIVTENG